MANREEAPYVIIRLHMFLLCNRDTEKCALLDLLMHLSGMKNQLVSMLEEEIALGNVTVTSDLDSLRGWVSKSASELINLLFIASTPRSVSRKLNELVDEGLLIKKPDLQSGQKMTVRPNALEIKRRLADLGYTVNGGIISEMVEGVEKQYTNPPKAAELLSTDEEFQRIPAAPVTKVAPIKDKTTGKTVTVSDEIAWILRQKLLEREPDHIRHLAYTFYTLTGFEPEGSNFVPGLKSLDKASDSKESFLVEGIKIAEKVRRTNVNPKGLILTGPHSYVGFVRDVRSQSKRPVTVNTDTRKDNRGDELEQTPPSKVGAMNGQKTRTVNGKTVIDMGGRRKVQA